MAPAQPLQSLFLLSDEPIGLSTHDGLGMNQTARVIAETALGAASPVAIGIFTARGHSKLSEAVIEPQARCRNALLKRGNCSPRIN